VSSAPVIIVVLAAEQEYRCRYTYPGRAANAPWRIPYWYVDAGAAIMLLLLSAANEGLGAALFGLPGEADELKTLLRISSDVQFVAMVAVGHPDVDPREARTTAALKANRVLLRERIHVNRWAGVAVGRQGEERTAGDLSDPSGLWAPREEST
jgi:nitroreductase